MNIIAKGAAGAALAAAASIGLAWQAGAQTLQDHSAEARLQLDFHVPDAALKPMIPAGWEPNIAAQGPAKDANIRVIFIDRIDITGADGKIAPKGSNQLVYLAAPIKQTGGTATAQLIIGGLTADAGDAPGPFGNYLQATTFKVDRSTSSSNTGPSMITEDWSFTAAGGEHLEVHAKYERTPVAKGGPTETRFYSAVKPDFYQIFKVEQGLDIARNATTGVDRVKEFSFKGGGGKYAPFFDGTEKVLSVDSIPWYVRTTSLP